MTTVDELEKYNLLYEQCANQGSEDVQDMMDEIDFFVRALTNFLPLAGLALGAYR